MSAAGGGDRQPAIGLAVALDARGHDVSWLCDATTSDLVAETDLPTIINDVPQVGYISGWVQQLPDMEHPPNPFMEWANLALEGVNDAVARFSPDVIVSSLFCMGLADLLASQLGVPWCFVNPSFYFGEGSQTTWDDDWYGSIVPRLARECFSPLANRANLVLHATDPIFDFEPARLPASHHYVGFLLWEPPTAAPILLDEPGDPWALVSASTARPADEATMLHAAIEGLAEHPVRPILTAPKGDIAGDISGAASVVGHIPHSLILQRSTISVNQASAGIVSKCLTFGVPMVLLPWDADQPGVATRAGAIGVATTVPRDAVTPEAVSQAVEVVLNQRSFRSAARDVAATLSTRNPARTAAELVEQL